MIKNPPFAIYVCNYDFSNIVLFYCKNPLSESRINFEFSSGVIAINKFEFKVKGNGTIKARIKGNVCFPAELIDTEVNYSIILEENSYINLLQQIYIHIGLAEDYTDCTYRISEDLLEEADEISPLGINSDNKL